VIACGGVGAFSDYAEGIRAGASAVAAANIWHFKELADALGKKAMMKEHIPVRSGRK
jgi:cyclase